MGELVMPVPAIRAAGSASAQVAAGVGGIDLGSVCAAVAAALPGSASAQAGSAAAGRWRTELTEVCARMGRHAQNLTDSAATYDRSEAQTTNLLASIMPPALPAGSGAITQALG